MNKVISFLKDFAIAGLIALVLFIVVNFFVQFGQVSGQSMEDTYYDGDRVLILKRFPNYEAGDIIVFTYDQEHKDYYEDLSSQDNLIISDTTSMIDEYHVKRIAGEPGDEIRIEDNDLYVNGQLFEESNQELIDQQYVLADDEYFVVGDNSDHSFDSRKHGPISEDDLFGEVITNK